MNILFFTPYYSMWNTTIIENLLTEELSKENNIFVLYCNDFMKNMCIAQDAEHKNIFTPLKDKLETCKNCKKNFKKISKNKRITYINIDNYFKGEFFNNIKKLNLENKSNDELLKFKIDNIDAGKMCLYEISLRKKKTLLSIDNELERAEVIEKLNQINKFNYVLKHIKKDFAPDLIITTNGFYYITNFFLKFFNDKKVKSVCVFNTSNYKFSRKDLRICYLNELEDKNILSENFEIYNKTKLLKTSLDQALANIETHIKKEHSHAFSPKYSENINIKEKFKIEEGKKIILVSLSSQAEIFSAINVLSLNFKKSLFNTQHDFIKFILEISNTLNNHHFIIRTHPRQYIGNISEEILELEKINFNNYPNVSINTPSDGLSPFNFIKDIDFIINSWSTVAVEMGIFGIENITIFPEYALYPKKCMNIINSKNDLVKKIHNIKKRNILTAITFLKYIQAENLFGVVSFKKNFLSSNLIPSLFSNVFEKFCFKFIYLKMWNLIKKIEIDTIDKRALNLFLNNKYKTYHESKLHIFNEKKLINNNKIFLNENIIKEKINIFTKKNFNFINFL